MTTFAPPVRRDNFLFSSLLYADAGNENHHPRASVAELSALLRPDVSKPSNKRGKPAEPAEPLKDPPWHFWTAQLLHYGQTSTKDKNAAKVRLLSALNGGRLEVPGWITRLEAELKKEWEAENRKLKKTTKQSVTTVPASTPAINKKKEAGKKELKSSTTSTMPNKSIVEKRDSKKVASKAVSVPASASNVMSKPAQGKRKLEEAAKPDDSNKKAKSKKTQGSNTSFNLNSNETMKKVSTFKTVVPEEDESWPAPQRIIIPHAGGYFMDHDYHASTRPSNAPRPGAYRISCPEIEAQWPGTSIDEFFLAFSASENEWWSRFKWGDFQGMIVLDRIPKRANKTVGVPFKWRAHYAPGNEDGEGTGKIFFISTTDFKGEFHNFLGDETCLFRGKQVPITHIQPEGPVREPFNTPVLDQMRIEWGQMPAIMRDAPAKKPRAKKTRLPEPTRRSSTPASPESEDEPVDIYLSGSYQIDSPILYSTFPAFGPKKFYLTLITDEQRGVWWAKFEWGSWSGIIQLNPGPTFETIDETHSLGWRIKDLDTGEMRFGRKCTGEMKFNGHERTLEGRLFEVPHVGTVEFRGRRIPGPRRVRGLQDEWDAFVREAYGR